MTTAATSRLVAGRYRLGDRLGAGGMGVVWEARDEILGRPVAVKEVRLPGIDDEERDLLRERTMREARTVARIDHPCAVRLFDVCEEDGNAFLVMELVDGKTLADVLRDDGPLTPARAAEIGGCLLDALAAAHAAGVVHRDVKPANVLVRADGRVTLTDFGIASTAGDPSITSTGLLLGSPAYISPERARGEPPEPASDIWSLGATLYTAVEGRPPYERPDPVATLMAVVTEEPPTWQRAGTLGPILDRMLVKDPAERPGAAELSGLLRQVSADPAAQTAADVTVAADAVRAAGRTVAVAPAVDREPSMAARVGAWVVMCAALFAGAVAAAAAATHGL